MRKFSEFIESRDRGWWRSYYATAVSSAERFLCRPLTLAERIMVVQVMRARTRYETLGSSGILGMNVAMAIETPDPWLYILFANAMGK